jgi:hypothetical protein
MAMVSPLADDNTGGLWKNHCSKPRILLRQLPVKSVASSQDSRQPILSVGVTQRGVIETARQAFHRHLLRDRVLAVRNGAVSNADRDNATSRAIAKGMASRICATLRLQLLSPAVPAGTQGRLFAEFTREYLEACLSAFPPALGGWLFVSGGSIDKYAQYAHLREVQNLVRKYPELRLALGGDYIIGPDVVVSQEPVDDAAFGGLLTPGDKRLAKSTFLRRSNEPPLPIMHASVSCKWTLRSDRAQNARTEALNLIRNRKGRVPSIAVVTAEPLPSRLASLAEGTGDVDRVYHIALIELQDALDELSNKSRAGLEQQTSLQRMVQGRRLADISDLPFDVSS